MGILVIGMIFVDIKGFPEAAFIPTGRNVGRVERVHGGVGRNVAEDIANCELRPTFLSLVDDSGDGRDVLRKLRAHKVNTDYIRTTPNGLGTWLAVFDNSGDVAASISNRLPVPTASSWKSIWTRRSSSGSSVWLRSMGKRSTPWWAT